VELLVAVGITGTLVALLLPAIQAARESARNASCVNNLAQLSRAAQNYLTSQQRFMPGDRGPQGTAYESNGIEANGTFGWPFFLASHLEWYSQGGTSEGNASYRYWSYAECRPDDTPSANFGDPKHSDLAGNQSPVFVCPSAESAVAEHQDQLKDYAVNAGTMKYPQQSYWTNRPSHEKDGLAYSGSSVKYLDGLSKKILFAERRHSAPGNCIPDRKGGNQVIWVDKNSQGYIVFDDDYPDASLPNSPRLTPNDTAIGAALAPYSDHPQHVNVAFAGGDVGFIRNDIDVTAYRQRVSIDDL
jgi:type II secretory pathway pseudopilin PulG